MRGSREILSVLFPDFRLWKVPERCKNLAINCEGYRPQTVNIEYTKDLQPDSPLLIKMRLLDSDKKQISLNEKAEKQKH